MKQEDLIKLLKHLDSVTTSDWNVVRAIVDGINAGEVHVLHSERFDWKKKFMHEYPLVLSKIEEWQELEPGIDLGFRYTEGSLICYVEIWGTRSSVYGPERSEHRWSAKLLLKDEFIENISIIIVRKFNKIASYRYEEYLDEMENLWIENYKQSILNS